MEKITCSASQRLDFDPVFVCGAPRTGTTLLLSLISTSQATNPLSAECDYFTSLVHPFIVGRNRFDLHTNCYFATLEDFEHYHADIMRGVLKDMWQFLDRPAKLVLKDPGMTRYANIILKLLPESRMIISIRDPRDVIASRVSIEMRRLGSTDPHAIGADFIDTICREYNAVHEYVLQLDEATLRRVKLVRYEQLVDGMPLAELSSFIGVDDLNVDKLWQRSLKLGERKSHSEWMSPLYGQKMSQESVGRHSSVLDAPEIERISAACSHTYQALLKIGGWDE
ncbi:MAG: sulfotransferase [Pseudomonadota bacterium]